jgi:hypothetical protein
MLIGLIAPVSEIKYIPPIPPICTASANDPLFKTISSS